MPLSDIEILVVATKVMRFSEKEALEYLRAHNHETTRATYYRILGHVESETRTRLFEICRTMKEQHLERIDEIDKIKKEMWTQYHREKEPLPKVRILKEIKELQPYVSAYNEATQSILEDSVKQFGDEENIDMSSLLKN